MCGYYLQMREYGEIKRILHALHPSSIFSLALFADFPFITKGSEYIDIGENIKLIYLSLCIYTCETAGLLLYLATLVNTYFMLIF